MTVILVGPEQGANVGFVARTMACYGVTDFRIVGAPGIAADEGAKKTGKAGSHLLESVRYFENAASAVADCNFSFGFTRRPREPGQRIQDLEDAVTDWRKTRVQNSLTVSPSFANLRTALVFGRESQGLFRDETTALSHLVRITMPGESLSLNLSHAVAIGLYAFLGTGVDRKAGAEIESVDSVSESGSESERDYMDGYPSQGENNAILEKLLAGLEASGYFRGGKEAAQRESTRFLWQRLRPTRRELEFLAGMLRRLTANS